MLKQLLGVWLPVAIGACLFVTVGKAWFLIKGAYPRIEVSHPRDDLRRILFAAITVLLLFLLSWAVH